MKLSSEELEDAYIDWYWGVDGAMSMVDGLEKNGYRFFFLAPAGADLAELGAHAVIADEFPHGDIVLLKKLGNPLLWKKLGLTPVTRSTRFTAKAKAFVSQAGGSPIELYSPGREWAAMIHPCARPGCEWQGSMLDSRGPHGHVEADTQEDAIIQLFEYTQDWELAPGAMDSIMSSEGLQGFKHPLHTNPPFSGWNDAWWLAPSPRDETKIAYRRKRDVLNVFMDWNQHIIDAAFNGPSQKHPPDSFDNFNHKYELKGKRQIDSFAKAVWFSLPAGRPYHIDDIDVNMLNETMPMMHNTHEQLTLPDYVEERRLLDQELAYWEEKYDDLLPEEDDGEVPF